VTTNSNQADKDWFEPAARLTMSADASNIIGDTHTFTALLEIDSDGDGIFETTPEGETIEFTLSGIGSLSNETLTDINGQATVDVDSTEVGLSTVTASWSGEVAEVTLEASDSGNKSWIEVNEPPVAEAISLTTCENTPLPITLVATDPNVDPENPEVHPLVFSIWVSPQNGMVSGDLTDVTYLPEHEANVDVIYSPAEDFLGTDTFTFMVEDPFVEFDRAIVTIEVELCGEPAGGGGGLEREIVINEVAWSGTKADPTHEWIELVNISDEEVDLTGWTLRWRKDETKEWKQVRLRGTVDSEDYYLLERLSDETISDIKADLIYDAEEPHKLPLLDEGEVIHLLNKDGLIVDTANAEKPELGWPGGSTNPVESMERIEPELEDTRENWSTNEGIIIKGKDRDIVNLTASASMINEKTLLARTFLGEASEVELGSQISFTVRLPEGGSGSEPRVLLASSAQAVAGGAGSVMTGAENALTANSVPGLPNYQVTFDTSSVQPGNYKLFIVVGNRVIHKQAFMVVEES